MIEKKTLWKSLDDFYQMKLFLPWLLSMKKIKQKKVLKVGLIGSTFEAIDLTYDVYNLFIWLHSQSVDLVLKPRFRNISWCILSNGGNLVFSTKNEIMVNLDNYMYFFHFLHIRVSQKMRKKFSILYLISAFCAAFYL